MTWQNRQDSDPFETADWLESLDAVHRASGAERVRFLIAQLQDWARRKGVGLPFTANTDYVNTIPASAQPPYPGDRAIERRIKSYVRWNAMSLVVRANRKYSGIGGHISTFASAATIYEVAFNHFFRARNEEQVGDHIFFQGHASPGIYARAFLEGRITIDQMKNFRRELAPAGGLSSYPHPWLMPEFWEFPTVSMGLGPLNAIYQARFNEYLRDRGLADTSGQKVWAFLGDGEMDEPESLGAITLAAREQLDNLIFVINCNLQRLDGPVRGNGNIIQELEAAFRGAGWNVIKVIWGSDWDALLEADRSGLLVKRMNETVDGQWQRYTVEPGAYARKHFFGVNPELERLVEHLTDDEIQRLRLGGHDPEKVYAALNAAATHRGQPSVVLVRTIKGYGLGEAGEGRNVTHQQKKLNEDELRHFRDRFEIPVADKDLKDAPFCSFDVTSAEFRYLIERRAALGGSVPRRMVRARPLDPPAPAIFAEFAGGSGDKAASTTMVFMRMLARLLADKQLGNLVVPIVPDEARTFGMEALFRTYGIYAHSGQLYEPVDHHLLLSYREARNGQILEEGITEAGSMASFIAAGTAYATHGVNTIPFFMFYSMFGFQRIGDSIWACADARGRGFLVGATAGRTTLNGEGLQHQDGHSPLLAANFPNIVCYDPAYAFELATIIADGIRRMYHAGESIFYYLTVYNENYVQPPMPPGVESGILAGLYKFRAARGDVSGDDTRRVHLLASGPIVEQALRAQDLLAEKFAVAADVWSATSFNQLYRDGLACDRWNMMNPDQPPRKPHVAAALEGQPWPIVAVSDYVKSSAARIARWAPGPMRVLGTDGFGRSDTRESLRRFFEIDAEHIAYAALTELAGAGRFERGRLAAAARTLDLDLSKVDPALA